MVLQLCSILIKHLYEQVISVYLACTTTPARNPFPLSRNGMIPDIPRIDWPHGVPIKKVQPPAEQH